MFSDNKLNQSLEKIVIIGLNLTLLVVIGVPLLFSSVQIISDSDQSITFQYFIQDLDESILLADQSRTKITRQIMVPENVSIDAVHNQLVFKIHLETWHIITRTYRCPIQLDGPTQSGNHLLSINVTEITIQITFQRL